MKKMISRNYRGERYVNLIVGLALTTLVVLVMSIPSGAATIPHVMYNIPVSLTVWNWVTDFGMPHGNNAITYIKYTVNYVPERTDAQAGIEVNLCHWRNHNGAFSGGGAGVKELSDDHFSTAPKSVTHEVNFDPLKGQGVSNYRLNTNFRGEDCHLTINIDEIRYNEYEWDTIKAEVTPEKYVKLTVARSEKIPYTTVRITNNVTGWQNSSRGVEGTYGTYTVTDTSVQPEKHYTYTIETIFGYSTFDPGDEGHFNGVCHHTPAMYTVSVTVPSDATLARQAAEDSKATSLLVKDDTEYIRNNLFPSLQNEISTIKNQNDSMQNKMNTIKNQISDIQTTVVNTQTPHIYKVSGLNGATCTATSSFKIVIQAPGATEFRVKADTGEWSEWTGIGNTATATGISGNGAHTITVEARNSSGVTSTGQMTIFKL